MPLHYCYLLSHIARLSLFAIFNILNYTNNPVIKQIIHLIIVHNPLCLFIKCIFCRQKLHDPPLAATEVRQKL